MKYFNVKSKKNTEEIICFHESFSDKKILNLHFLMSNIISGGSIIGARNEHEITGFVISFPFSRSNKFNFIYFLFVHPKYRNQNIGFSLMNKLKNIALRKKINKLCWTFDLFDQKACHLHFNKLNVNVKSEYYINLYDNELISDRVIATWDSKNIDKCKESNFVIIEKYMTCKNNTFDKNIFRHKRIKIAFFKNNNTFEYRQKFRFLMKEYLKCYEIIGFQKSEEQNFYLMHKK